MRIHSVQMKTIMPPFCGTKISLNLSINVPQRSGKAALRRRGEVVSIDHYRDIF